MDRGTLAQEPESPLASPPPSGDASNGQSTSCGGDHLRAGGVPPGTINLGEVEGGFAGK